MIPVSANDSHCGPQMIPIKIVEWRGVLMSERWLKEKQNKTKQQKNNNNKKNIQEKFLFILSVRENIKPSTTVALKKNWLS